MKESFRMKASKIALFILVIFLVSACNLFESEIYMMSVDENDRPINKCLGSSVNGLFAAMVAMNCQKSVMPRTYLCSDGRILKSYSSEKQCLKEHGQLKVMNGLYSLENDPRNK